MPQPNMRDCHVLIVEDEYFLAEGLRCGLSDLGATVIGPVATVEQAMQIVTDGNDRIDGAVLDVNLRGEMIYPVADRLIERGVPIVFTTGYDESAIPGRFRDIPRCEKPVNLTQISRAIGAMIGV